MYFQVFPCLLLHHHKIIHRQEEKKFKQHSQCISIFTWTTNIFVLCKKTTQVLQTSYKKKVVRFLIWEGTNESLTKVICLDVLLATEKKLYALFGPWTWVQVVHLNNHAPVFAAAL